MVMNKMALRANGVGNEQDGTESQWGSYSPPPPHPTILDT